MEFAARYTDGLFAEAHDVLCRIDLETNPLTLVISNAANRHVIERWVAADIVPVHGRAAELRLGSMDRPSGARLSVTRLADIRRARALLPLLARRQRLEGVRQFSILALATAALFSVIVAYLYGVPLLAGRLVWLVPPAWEVAIGDAGAAAAENRLTGGKGFVLCDANPQSTANRAIARFAAEVFDGTGSPFTPDIEVVQSATANAFALPGGRSYLLSALIEAARSPDELAGVLSHELGHVYLRHGTQSLIANSATGLLVGFVLGDMTGLSVASGIGSSLISNRFTRQDEAAADHFAGTVAQRLGFRPSALGDLLTRVAGDDAFTRAGALFMDHPLTADRLAALKAMDAGVKTTRHVFTPAEWTAIKAMCPPLPPEPQ